MHVTVRILAGASSPLVNEATVTAPDPAYPEQTLTDSAEDSDVVRSLSVTKTSDAAPSPLSGDVVTFTVTVTNDGPGAYTSAEPASVTDELRDVLDDAAYRGDAASTVGEAPTVAGDGLAWSGPLAGGESAVITYSVLLKGGGDGHVGNRACVPDDEVSTDADPCATVSFGVTAPPTTPVRQLGATGARLASGAIGAGVLVLVVGAALLTLRRRPRS